MASSRWSLVVLALPFAACLFPDVSDLGGNGGGDASIGDAAPDVASDVPIVPFVSATGITVGGAHACAVRSDGTVLCWGANGSGQIGDGTGLDTGVPALVGNLSDAVQVSAGGDHVCAVRKSGAVACWGANDSGQLGAQGNDASTPVPVAGLTDAVTVACGHSFTCALKKDATVACWGDDYDGELGDGASTSRSSPVVVAGLSDVVSLGIGADSYHACAATTAGTVYCWGNNDYAQTGSTGGDVRTPKAVPAVSGAVAVAAGGTQSCAVLGTGAMLCWGDDYQGQLGNATTSAGGATPVSVFNLADATVATLGYAHSCAFEKSGAVSCWGDNEWGELGSDPKSASTLDVPATVHGLSDVVQVAAGNSETCALTQDGHVSCWGCDRNGRVGLGTRQYATSPVAVVGETNVQAIATGTEFSCAIESDGGVSCWGSNDTNGLANNSVPATGTPVPAGLPVGAKGIVASTSVNSGHACIDGNDGLVHCWGYGQDGELGAGGTFNSRKSVVFGGSDAGISGIATWGGHEHQCILSDGGVECSGDNTKGELGNGSIGGQLVLPVAALLPSPAAMAAAGGYHTCAVTTANQPYCWGNNTSGELGDGTTTTTGTPVALHIDAGVPKAFALGFNSSCALVPNGDVWCWGSNNSGQLGTTGGSSLTPVKVTLPKAATQITTSAGHVCALLADGTVQCWGSGSRGELGNGAMADAHQPVTVTGLTGALAVSAGSFATCALLSDHTVACWGANDTGELGDGTPMVVSTPSAVVGL